MSREYDWICYMFYWPVIIVENKLTKGGES